MENIYLTKPISELFDSEFGDGGKAQRQKERKRFTNQKSYYRVQARKKFVDDETVDAIVGRINSATDYEELSTVKDFFQDLRVVRNPKAKDDLIEEAFTNVVKFLEIDSISEAEKIEKDMEEEFWRRYIAIASNRLAERLIELYHTDGVMSALTLMDSIAMQGSVNV